MQPFRFFLAALFFPALLCLTLPARAQDNSQYKPQAIRISVDRVSVGVIVTDARGHLLVKVVAPVPPLPTSRAPVTAAD